MMMMMVIYSNNTFELIFPTCSGENWFTTTDKFDEKCKLKCKETSLNFSVKKTIGNAYIF